MHSPFYTSYTAHYMEAEPMRVVFESWFVKYKVDVVLAGHVHAYERSVSSSVPIYIYTHTYSLILIINYISIILIPYL